MTVADQHLALACWSQSDRRNAGAEMRVRPVVIAVDVRIVALVGGRVGTYLISKRFAQPLRGSA
jgi:hypothetical protein